jgi:hypothetical protein
MSGLLARSRVWAWSLVAAGAVAPSLAHAESSTASQCIAAAEQAQPLRDRGKLRAAREKLLACSRPECPSFVRTDCTKWLADLDSVTPKVVFSAVDSSGTDLAEVRVSVDGELVAPRLDGRELEIDPGSHVIRFEHAGSAPVEQQIIIREGDLHRTLSATFPLAAAPAPALPPPAVSAEPVAERGGRSLALPIALMGIGAAGLAVASYFWASGLSDHSTLGSTCAATHSCSQSAVDAGQAKLIAGDVSGGLGVVAAAVGLGILVFGHGQPQTQASGTTSLHVQPVAGGAAIGVLRQF